MPAFSVSNDIEFQTEVTSAEHQQNYTEIENMINSNLIHSDGYNGMDDGVELLLGANATVPLGATTKAQMDAAIAAAVPPGVLWDYTGAVAPSGWAIPVGQSVSKAANPTLWALYGNTYGSSTTETFVLPNLSGRFVAAKGSEGWNDTTGETGGTKDAVVVTHNHTQDAHNHTQDAHAHSAYVAATVLLGATANPSGTMASPSYPGVEATANPGVQVNAATATNQATTATNQAAGVSGTDQNLPPYFIAVKILRLG